MSYPPGISSSVSQGMDYNGAYLSPPTQRSVYSPRTSSGEYTPLRRSFTEMPNDMKDKRLAFTSPRRYHTSNSGGFDTNGSCLKNPNKSRNRQNRTVSFKSEVQCDSPGYVTGTFPVTNTADPRLASSSHYTRGVLQNSQNMQNLISKENTDPKFLMGEFGEEEAKAMLSMDDELEILNVMQKFQDISSRIQNRSSPRVTSDVKYVTMVETLSTQVNSQAVEIDRLSRCLKDQQSSSQEVQDQLSTHILDLKKQLAEKEDEVSALQVEQHRTLKSLHKYKDYLGELPTKEELFGTKKQLDTKMQECSLLSSKLDATKQELIETFQKVRNMERTLEERNDKISDLTLKVNTARDALEKFESLHKEAQKLGSDDVEHLLWQKEKIESENNRLKQMLVVQKEKLESQRLEHDSMVTKLRDRLSVVIQEQEKSQEEINKKNTEVETLEAKLKESISRCTSLEVKVSDQKTVLERFEEAESHRAAYIRQEKRLVHDITTCVSDIHDLVLACQQLAHGGHPDMSIILGIKSLSINSIGIDIKEDNDNPENLPELLSTMKNIQREIDSLRQKLSGNTAQNVADNMTSCITQ